MDEFEGQRTYAGNPPSHSDELRVQRSLWQRLNKKALSVILFLNIIGSILILVGVIVQGGKGVEYFILGSICVLPGGYALYHIYKACRATNIDDRDRHLEYYNNTQQRHPLIRLFGNASLRHTYLVFKCQFQNDTQIQIKRTTIQITTLTEFKQAQQQLYFLNGLDKRQLAKSEQEEFYRFVQEEPLGHSFFVYNSSELRERIRSWQETFAWITPYYAIKSNPCEAILKDVNKRLGTFDCASKSEIAQVLKIGGQANKIVFSNPVKEEMDLIYANHKGVQLTIADTIEELIKIATYAPNMKILWRLSIQENVAEKDTELKNGVFSGKFGDDFTDLEQAKERFDEIYQMGIKLHGIHFHCGTSVQGSQSFGNAVDLARECLRIGRECGHSMEILDIGGGFPQGEIHESAKIALRKTYQDPLGYQVISEPGRHFSSNTCYLLFKVMSKRIKKNQICYHVNDSLYHSFNCILTDSKKFEKETVKIYDMIGSKTLEDQILVSCSMFGMTCDGIDVISHEIFLPNNLKVGDWLCISGMGSYTLGSKSNFNGMKATTKIIKWKQRGVSSSETL